MESNTAYGKIVHDIYKEAEKWTAHIDAKRFNGNKNDRNQNEQIVEIAKLISAHVSEILIQRLNIDDNEFIHNDSLMSQTVCSTPTPTKHQNHSPRPQSRGVSRNSFIDSKPRSRASNSLTSSPKSEPRFHGEYRLSRTSRPTQTPLENRAFQLRRKSLESRKVQYTKPLNMNKHTIENLL